MPSRYVSKKLRSKRSAGVRSPADLPNNRCQSLSPLEALLGTDDSILETVENEICGNDASKAEEKNYSTNGAKNIQEYTMELDSYSQSEYCDLSQKMRYDLKRPLDYGEPAEEEKEKTVFSNFLEEEYEWHDQTLFDEAFVDPYSDASNDEFNSCNTAEQPVKSQETRDKETLIFPEIRDEQSSCTSDEFLIEDLSLQLVEEDEFSIMRSTSKSRDNINVSIDPVKQDKKVPGQSNAAESFYGLPERVKTLIQKTKKITCLYDWQDECLNLDAIKNRTNLIYALPTSGGKTLVAEILMLKEMLCNKKNVIFVLPFVAIVQEKVQSMTQFALELGFLVEEYASGKGQYPPVKRRRKNCIYICTIEKAQGLLNSLIELKRLNEIGIVVVDELHLLGENGGRGATLEGLLTKLMFAGENVHIVGMSATIGNLKEIANFLKADVYAKNFRPVEIKEYVKCKRQIWLVNLHDDPILTDEKKINYPYSEKAEELDPDHIGGLVMDVVPNDSCLLFCSTRKNCESVALLLTRVLLSSVKKHKVKEKTELLGSLKYEGELCPILSKTIEFGVAYHHSGLTSEERKLLEDAFREGTLCVLCCTSTLAAGVNLPARRVILRQPYIGNQFMNLSRYKQMIGRAGRAGMGEIGESILICKTEEIDKVQELLTSRMDDCLSTLHLEEDRGINNLILSSVMLSVVTTRSEIHKLVGSTLLGVQEKRLEVNVKCITDSAITSLLKAGVLRIKRSGDFDPNVTVDIESQINDEINYKPSVKKEKRTVVLSANTIFEPSPLGKAAMKGSVDLKCAHTLYQDLRIAQTHMVLRDDLHIMYLVTPYDLAAKLKPVGPVFYNVITSMPSSHMLTPRVLGINEATLTKLRAGATPKGIEPRVINRFWLTLILYELWQHRPLYIVAEKYQVNRGIIQNLLNVAATFANSVVRFCQELQEFWVFTSMLSDFSKKLRYCCTADLEPLMELPAVKVGRARQLFNAGYKDLKSIAQAKPEDLEAKIKNLPKNTVRQIIAAARLLLMEELENLCEAADDIAEGLNNIISEGIIE